MSFNHKAQKVVCLSAEELLVCTYVYYLSYDTIQISGRRIRGSWIELDIWGKSDNIRMICAGAEEICTLCIHVLKYILSESEANKL